MVCLCHPLASLPWKSPFQVPYLLCFQEIGLYNAAFFPKSLLTNKIHFIVSLERELNGFVECIRNMIVLEICLVKLAIADFLCKHLIADFLCKHLIFLFDRLPECDNQI